MLLACLLAAGVLPAGPARAGDTIHAALDATLTAAGEADAATLDASLDNLIAARDGAGLASLEPAGIALARMGALALRGGATEQAGRLAKAAMTVAPDSPEGYLVASLAQWRAGAFGDAIGTGLTAARVGLGHYWVGTAWLGYMAIITWLAAASAFAILLIPGVWAGVRAGHHLLREMGRFGVPAWLTGGAALAVAAMPLAAGAGVGWVVLCWVILAWLGDASRSRRVQLVLLLAVLMGPWLCAPFLAVREPAMGPLRLAMAEGGGGVLATGPVPAPEATATGDWRMAFALGNAALRDGGFDTAVAWYTRALALGGDVTRLEHNIATAHFKAGRTEQGERMFAQLAEGPGANVLTLFNLGQARSHRLDFESARAAFDRARQTDPDAYLKVMMVGGEGGGVIPFPVTQGDARALLLSQSHGWERFAASLWEVLFGGIPVFLAPLVIFAAAGLFWLLPRLARRVRVGVCAVCATTVCPACMRFVGGMHLCPACGDDLMHARAGEVEVRMRRDRYGFRRVLPLRALARMIPGVPAMWRGNYGVAAMQLFVLAFGVWWMALLGTVPAWAVGVSLDGWPAARAVAGTLLALYVAIAYLTRPRTAGGD